MIKTYSKFYFGHIINTTNNYLDFDDGNGQQNVALSVGSYTLTEFVTLIENALNGSGTQTYTVSVDRVTRKITISAPSNFSLLLSTGSFSSVSVRDLLGFTTDQTASNSYTGTPSGSEYSPQRKLQKFLDKKDNTKSLNPTIHETISGVYELINFGQVQYYEMNIDLINNYGRDGSGIRASLTAVEDCRAFLDYMIIKNPCEFIPDENQISIFDKVVLSSTQYNNKGIGYRLYEMYDKGLIGYYETKLLKFRVI